MKYWFILIPPFSAFTGFVIVRVLSYFLFRPFHPRIFFGFSFQGWLPSKLKPIASAAGKFAASAFTGDSVLKDKLADPKNFDKLRPVIEEQIDDFLRNRLKVAMPMVGMFIGDRTIDQLKPIFIGEIEKMFPMIMERFSGDITKDLQLEKMVEEKISQLSPMRIEELLKPEIHKNLSKVYAVAMVIGLLVGIVQILLIKVF